MYSQLIAAPDPTPFNKPRFIRWPSVCDTTRTNWLGPEEPVPAHLSPALQYDVEYACPSPPLLVSQSPPLLVSAPPADSSLTFTAIAAQSWSPSLNLGPWTLDVGPGIPLPPPLTTHPSPTLRSKRGRPLVFDEVKRAEFIGMLKAGFTIRYAARRVGVSHVAVFQARDRDPQFAAQIVQAQRDRDFHCVRRIHNAGKKSWRAAAWILERVQPKEFSLNHKNRDPWTVRGQRRLKKLINEILDSRLADHTKTGNRNPLTDQALRLIDCRLDEIDSQYNSYDERDDDELDDDSDALGERGGLSPPITPDEFDDELNDDELNDDESDEDALDDGELDEDFEENDGYESEETAVACYRQALRKLHHSEHEIARSLARYRHGLRKRNARLRQRR